jgi:hypothetical protein
MEVSIVDRIRFYWRPLIQAGVLKHPSRNVHEVKNGL